MDVIVDTSVLIAVIANEPEKPALVALTSGANLIAPGSVHWEIGNAFSAMLRHKRITAAQARQALEIYGGIPIRFVDVDLSRALEIADQLGIYAYDAYLIVCALQHKCALLALDRGLVHSANRAGVEVLEVAT